MSKTVSKSLRAQLLASVLLSFAVAAITFSVLFFTGSIILEKTVYGKSFALQMSGKQSVKLQNYINEESISPDNLHRLNAWCSRGDKVYLTIYRDDILIYESPVSGVERNDVGTAFFDPEMEDPDNEYILTMQGDVKVRAFLYYYAGDAIYLWMTVLSGIAAFIAFSVCFIMMINKKVSYIKLLKRELDILAGGQLEYSVTVTGSDELGELASGIDHMRTSILNHMEIEKKMRTASSELITAMSHDLRTPLTSLLAYLEMVERRKCSDESQMYELIRKSIVQTMRIRDMADDIFEYFLVYDKAWDGAEMEATDANQAFGQIMEELSFSLKSEGFSLRESGFRLSGNIKINADLLNRVFDNIYSNLLKYADREQPVSFTCRNSQDHILLIISNRIAPAREKKESTNIGLNTCRRIIEYHGGTFLVSEEGGCFMITVALPVSN